MGFGYYFKKLIVLLHGETPLTTSSENVKKNLVTSLNINDNGILFKETISPNI